MCLARRVAQEGEVVVAELHSQHQAGLEEAVEGEGGTPCWVGDSLSCCVVV